MYHVQRFECCVDKENATLHFSPFPTDEGKIQVDILTNEPGTYGVVLSVQDQIRLRDWLNALPLPKSGLNATDAIGQNVPVVSNGSDPMSMTTRFALLVDRVITLEREADDAARLHAELCERVKTLEANTELKAK